MKKVNAKFALLGLSLVLTMGTLATSCSKDDDGYEEPTNATIDPAVGTYKGKLTVYTNSGVKEWYNAVTIVTKEGSNKLKFTAKTGEPYSLINPKTFTVETGAFFGENTQDIVSLTGSLEGIFHFYGSNKNISVIAEKQSETELQYHYEGVKQ